MAQPVRNEELSNSRSSSSNNQRKQQEPDRGDHTDT